VFLIRRDGSRAAEIEALARYVDAPSDADEGVLDRPLRLIVGRLRRELRPVEPSSEFVGNLRVRLVAGADQRVPAEDAPAAWRQPRYIAIGAAGLVSAAAVIALVARSRAQAQPRQAA
jgi:hypothetical protein